MIRSILPFRAVPALLPGIAVLLCLLAPQASAQLKWERTFADLRASPDDTRVEVRFPFVNAGPRTVTIQKLKSSCGCTTASASKASYAPGEHGEVIAVFEIGNRTGLNEKNVRVTTDDPAAPETVLEFHVTIGKTVSMNPAVLFWKPGDEKTSQLIRIKVVRDTPLNLVRAECPSPAWKADLQTVRPGWEYALNVTLLDSKQNPSGTITVVSDTPKDNPQVFHARLRVK